MGNRDMMQALAEFSEPLVRLTDKLVRNGGLHEVAVVSGGVSLSQVCPHRIGDANGDVKDSWRQRSERFPQGGTLSNDPSPGAETRLLDGSYRASCSIINARFHQQNS